MKRRIKYKILGSVILIVIFSLTASSMLAYWHFSSILENQTIRDGEIHLQQTANQMNQLIDDIQKYSANMVNDDKLQNFAVRLQYPSIYDELSAYADVVQQLTKFNVLRDYLDSSAIVRTDGKVFWSTMSFDTYFDQELQKSWYQDAIHSSAKSGFTVPHILENKQVVTFFIRLDAAQQGVLLLNIKYEAFAQIINYLNLSFDQYAWINKGQAFFLNKGIQDNVWEQLPLAKSPTGSTQVRAEKGFYLIQKFDKTDWSVVSFISRDRFYQNIKYVAMYWLGFLIICLTLCFTLFLPIISSITRPISQMSKAMKQVSLGNYNIQLTFKSKDELFVLKNGFEMMVQNIQRQIAEKIEQEQWKRRMSAELLFAQINPHFVYNTLNTVVYLARKQRHAAIEEMVEAFIGILHDAVQIGDANLHTTLRREIEIINHYVRIQKYRYSDRFELVWDVDEPYLDFPIPKSLIQPLVENSIFHGISAIEGKGRIDISVTGRSEELMIVVRDNGVGMDPATMEQMMHGELSTKRHGSMKNIGIRNIQERIKYLCGEPFGLEISSLEDQGTVVTLHLPLMEQENDESVI
jgi:two-component system sensor histidine kinase YesM